MHVMQCISHIAYYNTMHVKHCMLHIACYTESQHMHLTCLFRMYCPSSCFVSAMIDDKLARKNGENVIFDEVSPAAKRECDP